MTRGIEVAVAQRRGHAEKRELCRERQRRPDERRIRGLECQHGDRDRAGCSGDVCAAPASVCGTHRNICMRGRAPSFPVEKFALFMPPPSCASARTGSFSPVLTPAGGVKRP